jgi:hypothetical protein
VGQSFPAERLGISLTRRLPTPPDRARRVLCLFLSTPVLQSKSKIAPDHEFGTNDGEDRQSTEIFVTAVVWLVYNSRHDLTALKYLRENRPQHATV